MSEKLNFERRIEDIQTIVGAIEGSSGGNSLISAMGADLPSIISKFNTSAQQTDASYQGSMKCPDIKPVNLFDVFKNKSVIEDTLLSDALQMFKNNRLGTFQLADISDFSDELRTEYFSDTIQARATEFTFYRYIDTF